MTAEDRRVVIGLGTGMLVLTLVFVLGALFDPMARSGGPPGVREGAPVGVRGPDGVPDYLSNPEEGARHVDQLARRSGGDFDRLTPHEQRWLNSLTAGRGRAMLRLRARRLGLPGNPPPESSRRPAAAKNRLPD